MDSRHPFDFPISALGHFKWFSPTWFTFDWRQLISGYSVLTIHNFSQEMLCIFVMIAILYSRPTKKIWTNPAPNSIKIHLINRLDWRKFSEKLLEQNNCFIVLARSLRCLSLDVSGRAKVPHLYVSCLVGYEVLIMKNATYEKTEFIRLSWLLRMKIHIKFNCRAPAEWSAYTDG